MANSAKRLRRLWDTYTFPGFRLQHPVRGVFGDPKARVITLPRRSKKRSAAAAVECISGGTTGARDAFAISPAGMRVSTWSPNCGVCGAGAVAR